jgi:hypothetical protein
VSQQRNSSDEIENRRMDGLAAIDAVVHGDLEDIEMFKVLECPIIDGRPVTNSYRRDTSFVAFNVHVICDCRRFAQTGSHLPHVQPQPQPQACSGCDQRGWSAFG